MRTVFAFAACRKGKYKSQAVASLQVRLAFKHFFLESGGHVGIHSSVLE